MADIKISELTQAESLSTSDLLESAVPYNGGFLSRRMSLAQLSNYLENYVQHQALTTTAKTIVSAINEILGDLANYYTTSQTYSKTEVDTLIAGVSGLHFEVVQQLPTTDIDVNTIYLVPKQDVGTQDIYDEFIYIVEEAPTPSHWEKIGTTEIDLSDYVTDTELTTILNDYVTSSGLNTILADYATTSAMATALANKVDKVSGKGLSTEDYTTTEKAKLNGIESGAEVNPIVATGSVFGSLGFDNVDKLIKLTADAQGSGKDLNDYKTEGFYYFDSNNIPTNIPTGNVNGFLAVIKSGNVVKQLWFRQGSETTQANTYVRLFMSSSSTWSTWRKYATTDDIPIVTDENVKQTAVSSSSNANYRLLLSKSASNTEETDGVQKSGSLYYNPYDDKVTVQNVDISNTANIATAKVTSLITSQYYFNLGSGSAVAMLEANSAATTSSPIFNTLPASSGTLALKSELPTNPVLWSEYNVLGAKNLIPYPWSTEARNGRVNRGITFTYSEEGYVTLNGTADSSSQPYMCFTLATDAAAKLGNELVVEGGKKYTLSIDRTDNRLWSIVYIRDTSGTSASVATRAVFEDGTVRELTTDFISLLYNSVFHKKVTFEILASGSYRLQTDLRVYSNSGSYTNAKGRVMLRCTDSGDDTWVKYAKSNYELTTLKAEYKQIATIENETTASRAYAKNELMIWYSNLYRVTSAISSGGTISGNVTATTLSAEIKAIRDALNI